MNNQPHTTIAIDRDVTGRASTHRQGRTIMGFTVTQRTGIVALVAVLLLGLSALAAAAAGQLRSGDSATSGPAPIAVAAPWAGTCRSDVAGCVPDEAFTPGPPAALPAPYTGPCRSDIAGCVPDEELAIPASAPTTSACVYASAEGIPGEGCAPAEPASVPIR